MRSSGPSHPGRLHQWHRSVFAVGHTGLDRHGLCMAAVLFRGKGALVSYQSAVWLWGLERNLEIPVHVSVRWRGHGQDAIGLHHCPALREEDIAEDREAPGHRGPANAARLRLDRETNDGSIERSIRRTGSDCSTSRPSISSPTRFAGTAAAAPCAGRWSSTARAASRDPAERSECSPRSRTLESDDRSSTTSSKATSSTSTGSEERFAVELDSWEHHRSRRSFEEDREAAGRTGHGRHRDDPDHRDPPPARTDGRSPCASPSISLAGANRAPPPSAFAEIRG